MSTDLNVSECTLKLGLKRMIMGVKQISISTAVHSVKAKTQIIEVEIKVSI